MSTAHTATVIDQSSTAGFQAWGTEFNAQLASCSPLLQTADTGQIDWTTVTLPGAGTDGGFEIWELNDSLFGTAPVYFKIVYGTNATGAGPQIKIQCGTSTNGAGTLGGTCLSTLNYCCYPYTSVNYSTTFDSYWCAKEGFFGFTWKATPALGSPPAVDGGFMFCRTCDSTGTPTAEGAHIYWTGGNNGFTTGHQSMRYAATAVAFTEHQDGSFCLVTQLPASSLDASGNVQAYVHYTVTPTVEPCFGKCTVRAGDVPQGTTFTVALVGTSARTYIAARPGGPSGGFGSAEATTSPQWANAFLYE